MSSKQKTVKMINIRELAEFDYWANNEVIHYLTSQECTDEKPLKIFSHILNAYGLWFERINKNPQKTGVWSILGVEELKSKNEEYHQIYLKILTENESDPDKNITYTNTMGETFTSAVKDILIHLLNHSSYHRGQVIQLLSGYGLKFPYIDYIHYKRKIKK